MRLVPLILLLAAQISAAPLQIPRVSDEELRPLVEWNRANRKPIQSAIRRALPAPLVASFERRPVWTRTVAVEGAHAISLHLVGVDLPSDARITLRGNFEIEGPIEISRLLHHAEIFTPPIRGEEITILVESSEGTFRIESFLEWFELDDWSMPIRDDRIRALDHLSCAVDATCVTPSELANVESYRKAVARMTIVSNAGGALCTGALIRDSDDVDSAAYFLTARHCVPNQNDATRATFLWEYRSSACNAGNATSTGQTFGATILTVNDSSDSVLLRLNEPPPAGSAFLEWSATPFPAQTPLYRISHPGGATQKFAASITTASFPSWCGPLPFPDVVVSQPTQGQFTGGSSGAPTITADGKIVGQLYGDCYDETRYDPCHYDTYYAVDGAFSAAAALFAAWLAPPSCPTPLLVVQPANSTTTQGDYAAASVVASRRAPFSYQWYRGVPGDVSNPFPGATSSEVALGPFDATTSIWVRVGNSCGTTDSAAATITVEPPCLAPNLTLQPQSQTVRSGDTATLRVAAEGTAPIAFQWYRIVNGASVAVDGATDATYVTPALSATTTFFAIAKNGCGQTMSSPATITVATSLRRRAARRG